LEVSITAHNPGDPHSGHLRLPKAPTFEHEEIAGGQLTGLGPLCVDETGQAIGFP
jgi:hypothetical protein